MHYHSQNLNDGGLKLLHGRAWLRRSDQGREMHWEWCFGKKARMFHWGIQFGDGDSNDGILLMAGIPWLFSLFIGISGIYRCKETELGVAIHSNAIWFQTFTTTMERNSTDPWWRKGISFAFPWQLDWHSTELLQCKAPRHAETVRLETRATRGDFLKFYDANKALESKHSESHPYRYVLKNGKIQEVVATIFVERMKWRARWWPFIPYRYERTSINVQFSAEVGEGRGSWKGGCVGCGYDFASPDETPLECLRRMEKERKFAR